MKKPRQAIEPVDLGPPLIDWSHSVAAIPERGLDVEQAVSQDVLEAVRAALNILACRRIWARYRIKSAGAGCYRVSGKLEADVTQACVITTDPIEQAIRSDFEAVFHPPEDQKHNRLDEDEDPLATVDTETIENGAIQVGRLIYEEIASLLDPYPRAPGSSFDWQDPKAGAPEKANPFAKLAGLKERLKDGE